MGAGEGHQLRPAQEGGGITSADYVHAGSGLGLPIIGKLLGHREAATTQRYAHLDSAPLRRAATEIGGQIAKALGG